VDAYRFDAATGKIGAGPLYGITKDFTTSVFYVNVDLFEQAGVPVPYGGWTWDEFDDACRKIAALSDRPLFMFMFRQFFAQIPEELVEAVRIDGASNWRIYWQLMLPLSGPVSAIVAIYTFLAAWNDFLGPLIYLNSPEKRTLALALNAFRGQYGISDAHLLMAASVVCMLPCIVLFFAAQRYFVESVSTTGLKS
jgi:ABC-type Fe3+ transport system permease subunit